MRQLHAEGSSTVYRYWLPPSWVLCSLLGAGPCLMLCRSLAHLSSTVSALMGPPSMDSAPPTTWPTLPRLALWQTRMLLVSCSGTPGGGTCQRSNLQCIDIVSQIHDKALVMPNSYGIAAVGHSSLC